LRQPGDARVHRVGKNGGVPAKSASDAVLTAAVDIARAAAVEVGGDSVGEHLRAHDDGDRLVTHAFAATLPGYRGWYWAVTVTRAPRSRTVTVDEVALLPGEGALLAPGWMPWEERVRPGDLSPGDLLPPPEDDPRLVPAYASGDDDPQARAVGFELGLGRVQVMSRDGRLAAADRWYRGDRGPDTAMARHAPGRCGTCGFYLPLEGSLRAGFGVCGNEITEADGGVVSAEYGCGAHSETRPQPRDRGEDNDVVLDDGIETDTPVHPGVATEIAVP
jgi:hypothetical protein